MAQQIELVIFDCDGVLIDSEIISARMLQAEAREWGVDISIAYILQNYVGRSYPKVLADMQRNFNIVLPDDFEEKYRARLLAAFERDLKIMTHVKDVLEALSVKFCVATSSSPKRVARSLSLVGLTEKFGQNVYTASLVANGKPAPDLFLYTAAQMGVAPQNCLVIEDSIAGVKAGLAAEMNVARFTGGAHLLGETDSAGAHILFDNFSSFFNHFPNLRA